MRGVSKLERAVIAGPILGESSKSGRAIPQKATEGIAVGATHSKRDTIAKRYLAISICQRVDADDSAYLHDCGSVNAEELLLIQAAFKRAQGFAE